MRRDSAINRLLVSICASTARREAIASWTWRSARSNSLRLSAGMSAIGQDLGCASHTSKNAHHIFQFPQLRGGAGSHRKVW
jgi:hypothetical protein